MPVGVSIRRVRAGFEDLPLPTCATGGSAGLDLRAAIDDPVTIEPMGRAAIPTGVAVALPSGYELQVRPRSGLALRHGITMINSPGTIDEDFRGEIQVLIINLGSQPFEIRRGDRIAQAVLSRYERIEWEEVGELADSLRGEGGFGSTGHR